MSFVLLDRTKRSCLIDTHLNNSARYASDTEDVFNMLFQQYEEPICSYLLRLLGDLARAQDITQETFIRAYCALLRGERWENPRAWLYRVASRLATDDYRRRKLLEWLPLSGAEPDPTPGVEAMVADQVVVQEALDALPPKYRIPLVLHVYAGYSVIELAEIQGLSESGVKSRLSRARDRLRQAYRQEEDR